MKKFCLSLMLVLCSVMCFSACSSSKLYSLVSKNIAEVRHNLYVGETENIKVSLISGTREKDYVINGYCTEPVEFGVLTFTLKNDVVMPEVVNYVLTVGTTRYDGVLEKNPYDGTYVCDVKKIIDTTDVVSAKIIAGEFVDSVQISNVASGWNVNHENALKLACSELKKELNTLIENDKFCGECYIKILNDTELKENHYFWYVNFVSRHGKTFAVIIDPISNEIMAKKTIWQKICKKKLKANNFVRFFSTILKSLYF